MWIMAINEYWQDNKIATESFVLLPIPIYHNATQNNNEKKKTN